MSALVPLTTHGMNEFDRAVAGATGDDLRAASIDAVQVNITLMCNLACRHCHVESSPKRTEEMDWETMQLVLDAARRSGARTLDITGGAPEMHPRFREFVVAARELALRVIVRTNLTIMRADGYTDLPEFFREQRVELVASLPCYLEQNVDAQRGKHVYVESIEAIKTLNAVGYGVEDRLVLDLVFNPQGPSLPPAQDDLEDAYRRELNERFGIKFTKLIAITNLPLGRFLHDLRRDGDHDAYETLLRNSFNPRTIDGLMCRHQLHVGHDGLMYDCDFNYSLGLGVVPAAGRHIRDFDPATFIKRRISTGEHCFGCTAGNGSSCGGALA
jgi:radical SAM/Cys-rich protein